VERDTVRVYEARAEEWRDARPPRFLDEVRSLASEVAEGTVVADLGCGAGLHLPSLPRPAVALDASLAMVRLARDAAPDAWSVQADLEALPFRRGALGGGWARASYLHLHRDRLPRALADLHHALAVGAPAHLLFLAGDDDGELPDDDFAGRWFAAWDPAALQDVFVGAGFDVQRCARDPESLNPSVYSADAGIGFARPGNRFWPAAIAAGLVTVDRDPRAALAAGIGMTDLVKRATPRADELTRDEYRDGLARVERLVRWLQPGAVCFVGLAGWRAAVDRKAVAGPQPDRLGGRPAYVMPSTSGLNARTPPSELADHLRAALELSR
jgi:double-stranded uracil-DNA glycosylase